MCLNDKFHSVSYNTMKFVLYSKKNNQIRKNQQCNLLRVKRIFNIESAKKHRSDIGVFLRFRAQMLLQSYHYRNDFECKEFVRDR